jgi:radical SAM-linked protein
VPEAPDATPAIAPPPPGQPRDKVRLRFRKAGALRLLSHHDLLRTFERMLRRAALPVRRTQGFHPHPRVVFALSLPLGVVGREEVVEIELDEEVPAEEVRQRLTRTAPPGLEVLSARRIGPRAGARVRGLCYGVAVPAGRVAEAARRVAEVLAAPACWVERARPPRRRLDLKPFLKGLRLRPAEANNNGAFLEIELRLTPAGTARPEEMLGVLGLTDLLDAGAVLERTRLELEDEAQRDETPLTPGPADAGPRAIIPPCP